MHIHTYIHIYIQIYRQKISHRDLKPENVLLVEASGGGLVCKVADFGLSNDMVVGVYMYICLYIYIYIYVCIYI